MAEQATSRSGSPRPASPFDGWVDLVRVQRAALAAAAALAVDWAGLLARCGERASDGLLALTDSRRDSPDPGALLLSALQQYVAGVADLPRVAGLRFYAELERRDDRARKA